MAVDSNSFFKYQEHRGQSGYKAAILVKEQSDTYYSMLVASETVPSVFGSNDSFDFDLLNSPVKGKIMGKMSLDDKEVEVLHHRDNVYRFQKLKGKVLDFLVVNQEFVGYKFTGTLSYRMNDATADVLRGTYTITPMSADPNPIMDCTGDILETLCFADVIPETMKVVGGTDTGVALSVVQGTPAGLAYTAYTVSDDYTETAASSAIVTESGTSYFRPASAGMYVIKADATGYAGWATTVRVVAAS